MKRMRSDGVPIRTVAPIIVEDYVAWCADHDEDPEEARAAYAVDRMTEGGAIVCPPDATSRAGVVPAVSTRSAADRRRCVLCMILDDPGL